MQRRSFVKASLAAGAVLGWPGAQTPAPRFPVRDDLAYRCGIAPSATAISRSAAQVDLFTQPLRVPAVLAPTDADATTDRYVIDIQPADVEVVPGTTTSMWTYAGTFPGPTIVATRGRTVEILQRNGLAVPTSVHLHGGHVPAGQDGHPEDLIAPGASRTYRYPNTQHAATLWYHDHRHHHTADAVYRGLAALYVLRDPDEDALGLPGGEREIPLVICDRSFAEDGQLIHPPHDGSSFFGDTALVNGVPHPFLEVEAVRYRFRLLNASNSRAYRLALSNGASFTRIGSDGGLLAAPVVADTLLLHPAERVEVVVDFAGAAGTSVTLVDELGAWPGLVRFDVVAASAPDGSVVPSALRDIPAPGVASVIREIQLDLDPRTGKWVLDGKPYSSARVDQFPKLGATERWRFTNVSPVEHPMHPHLVMFQVVARNDDPPEAGDEGWKDTVTVPPGESVDVVMRFEDHVGRFVYHCHNLEHEDHDMMAQFKVVDLPRLAGNSRIETAVAIADARFTAPIPVAYIATANDFPDALAAGPAVAAQGGALLLTRPDELPDETAAALDRLAPQRIVVLGGDRAVSPTVERALAAHTTGGVSRLRGDDRYATTAAISATYAPTGRTVYVASGRGFADALGGGAAAAAIGAGLLLTEPDALPRPTADELTRLQPSRIVLLGGPGAVSRGVEQALAAFGPVDRIPGQDRFDTAARVVADAFPSEVDEVVVATGTSFPDALAGTPAARGAPLLLVAPNLVPAPTVERLRRLRPKRIVILGGVTAVSPAVERALATYLPD